MANYNDRFIVIHSEGVAISSARPESITSFYNRDMRAD